MVEPLRIFIGFDSAEVAAYHVLSHSIIANSTTPVSITPLCLKNLQCSFTRQRNPLESTEFSLSRFMTPYLSGYRGWSVFMDCDMLMFKDITQLFQLSDDRFAVMCVKHDYIPKNDIKFLGQTQTKYQKKNWSSVMLFNNAKCNALTPEYVNKATGLELHQFKWLADDSLIGAIPATWNHLVGEYDRVEDPALVHYTIGGPYFVEYKDCDYAAEWFEAKAQSMSVMQRKK